MRSVICCWRRSDESMGSCHLRDCTSIPRSWGKRNLPFSLDSNLAELKCHFLPAKSVRSTWARSTRAFWASSPWVPGQLLISAGWATHSRGSEAWSLFCMGRWTSLPQCRGCSSDPLRCVYLCMCAHPRGTRACRLRLCACDSEAFRLLSHTARTHAQVAECQARAGLWKPSHPTSSGVIDIELSLEFCPKHNLLPFFFCSAPPTPLLVSPGNTFLASLMNSCLRACFWGMDPWHPVGPKQKYGLFLVLPLGMQWMCSFRAEFHSRRDSWTHPVSVGSVG